MKFDLKKVKCVITDFDLTLYSFSSFDNTEAYYLDYLQKIGVVKDNKNAISEMKKNHKSWHNLQCTMQILKDNGKSTDDFLKYMGENPYNILSDTIKTINPAVVEKLAGLYPVYLLSDSAPGYISHYLKMFNLNSEWFVKCVSNDYKSKDMAKSEFMKQIVKETGLKNGEILMVGDSELHDIVPAKKLKLQTCHVKDIHDTEKIFNELIDFKKTN